MRHTTCNLALACLMATSAGYAQSLGDIAKAEQARRAAVKQPARVYTDKDLVASREVPVAAPPPAAPAASKAPAEDSTIAITIKPPAKDEAYWKDRMRVLRAQLESDQTFEREATARERRLSEEAHRVSIGPAYTIDLRQFPGLARAWQDAAAEAGRLKAAIINDRRAITALEEEARRAGILPGWLLP